MVTSRIHEELDSISNSSKEDRRVISGLTSKTPKPAEWLGWRREENG
jgi:hypothetical protein